MSAVAVRHPEVEDTLVSSPVAPPFPAVPEDAPLDWSETSVYVDRFIGASAEDERAQRRKEARRHKSFANSTSVVVAGALLLVQLVVLISFKAAELKVVRQASQLDHEIGQTVLDISLDEKKLAVTNSLPRLNQWADQLHYHKATQGEMDDVTSSARLPIRSDDSRERTSRGGRDR